MSKEELELPGQRRYKRNQKKKKILHRRQLKLISEQIILKSLKPIVTDFHAKIMAQKPKCQSYIEHRSTSLETVKGKKQQTEEP